MNSFIETVKEAVGRYREEMLKAERYIWNHPQTGFKEWKANDYLKRVFTEMGYVLTEAGNIPGFYFDIDTGRKGPTLCILGELDSVLCAEHPECDPDTKAVHACGHNCQAAALIGVAGGLKDPRLLDRMSGRIRIMAVPAEELLELGDRVRMREEGILRYFGGKTEFIYRGYFDDVDLALMIHSGGAGREPSMHLDRGTNGAISKTVRYYGKAAHAAGDPQNGINALYAAHVGLAAVNSLRETFEDNQYVRFHPILTEGGIMTNNIPARATIETHVRAVDLDVLRKTNDKINRALTGAALSMGAQIEIDDLDVYMAEKNDPRLGEVIAEIGRDFLGEENVKVTDTVSLGSSDMGNLSMFLPVHQPYGCGGTTGAGHGADYRIVNPENAVVLPAMIEAGSAVALLENGAARAGEVLDQFHPTFPDGKAFLKMVDEMCTTKKPIVYHDKSAEVDWH